MANSRIPGGAAVAILGAIGAAAGLDTLTVFAQAKLAIQRPIILVADPTPLIPPATVKPVAILPPVATPPAKVDAVAKRPPTPAPAHVQTPPMIPPATVTDQLSPPPKLREPLPLKTELLPLAAPAASTPPKPPAS